MEREKILKGLKIRRELAAEMKLHMGFTIFFFPTHAFMATSFTYFWVQGVRKYLQSFGLLVLAWGSHFWPIETINLFTAYLLDIMYIN